MSVLRLDVGIPVLNPCLAMKLPVGFLAGSIAESARCTRLFNAVVMTLHLPVHARS